MAHTDDIKTEDPDIVTSDAPMNQPGITAEHPLASARGNAGPARNAADRMMFEDKILTEQQILNPDFIDRIKHAIETGDEGTVKALGTRLHPADMADLLEMLEVGPRHLLLALLGEGLNAGTLVELDDKVREDVVDALPTHQLAQAIASLETDDATSVLEEICAESRAKVFAELPTAERIAVEAALDYPEDSAGRLMQRQVFAAPAYWTVGQVIERLRMADCLPEKFYEVFVIDPAFKTIGSIDLSQLIKSSPDLPIQSLAGTENFHPIPVKMDQEEVAYLFEKYNLISAPVVNENDRLVGMITVDDVVEIVHEETHKDMLALACVDIEAHGQSYEIREMIGTRFSWLLINLGTTILASIVISLFGATLKQAVAIAILMPIVASMGGNAGTQTLTVAVRNIATKNLTQANTWRVVGRESLVSIINGVVFALIMGGLAGTWYGTVGGGGDARSGFLLASVLGGAMIITMLSAGLAGILVPLGLQRAGADPAVSSTVFVTTITDITGFGVFLGLAALFLI